METSGVSADEPCNGTVKEEAHQMKYVEVHTFLLSFISTLLLV